MTETKVHGEYRVRELAEVTYTNWTVTPPSPKAGSDGQKVCQANLVFNTLIH